MNSVALKSVSLHSVSLNTVGLNSIGIPSSRKSDNSLIDCWFFKNKTNSDADRDKVVGVKGNVLTLNGFAFSEMSGYGGYNTNFRKYSPAQGQSQFLKTDSFYKLISIGLYPLNSFLYLNVNSITKIPPTVYKISNLPTGTTLKYGYANTDILTSFVIEIAKDGIYTIPEVTFNKHAGWYLLGTSANQEIGLTIEQLPLHPNCLVFDGVDDWAQVVGGNIWGKTVIMRCTPLKLDNVLYDQRVNLNNIIGIVNNSNTIAYSSKNNGQTYIDGILNQTQLTNDLINIDHIITSVNSSANENTSANFLLGSNIKKRVFAQMSVQYLAVYKEVLTPEQITQEIDKLEGELIEPYARYDVKEQGATNETMRLNPYLKNLQGNSDYDINLKNFLWALDSGVGRYSINFKSWMSTNKNTLTITNSAINITKVNDLNNFIEVVNKNVPKFKIKVTGLTGGQKIRYHSFEKTTVILADIKKDGIYELPEYTLNPLYTTYVGFRLFTIEVCNITIEQIPENSDGLYFDGVDDYGICDGFPILTDYTVIAKRSLPEGGSYTGSLFSKSKYPDQGAFILDLAGTSGFNVFSFGKINQVKLMDEPVSCQTKNSYNGNPIISGSKPDYQNLWMGTLRNMDHRFSKMVFFRAVFYDRSLTRYEIKRAKRRYFKTEE